MIVRSWTPLCLPLTTTCALLLPLTLTPDHMYTLLIAFSDPSMFRYDCDYRIEKAEAVGWRSRFCSVILHQPAEAIPDVVLVVSLGVNLTRRLSSFLLTPLHSLRIGL